MTHQITARIYYEDTDAGGVVYHANHLKFAERARTELLRFLGFENKSIFDLHGVIFVVRRIEADYIRPGRLDDLLTIKTTIAEVKKTSVLMKQTIFRHEEKIFDMNIALVCIDGDKHKPTALPADVKTAFERYMNDTISKGT